MIDLDTVYWKVLNGETVDDWESEAMVTELEAIASDGSASRNERILALWIIRIVSRMAQDD